MAVSLLRRTDFVVGLALVALGGLATWLALQISPGPLQRTLAPNVMPLICSIGIMGCGVVLAARAVILGSPALLKAVDLQQLLAAALIGVFLTAFPQVDFRASVVVFTLAMMLLLGCRSPMQLVLTPLLTAGAIWLVFGHFFQVYLPRWI